MAIPKWYGFSSVSILQMGKLRQRHERGLFLCFIQCLSISWAFNSGLLWVTGEGNRPSNHIAPDPSPGLPLQKGAEVWGLQLKFMRGHLL